MRRIEGFPLSIFNRCTKLQRISLQYVNCTSCTVHLCPVSTSNYLPQYRSKPQLTRDIVLGRKGSQVALSRFWIGTRHSVSESPTRKTIPLLLRFFDRTGTRLWGYVLFSTMSFTMTKFTHTAFSAIYHRCTSHLSPSEPQTAHHLGYYP